MEWFNIPLSKVTGRSGLMTDGNWIISENMSENGEVRLIQLADIGIGSFLDRSNKFISYRKCIELNCTELKENDILISRMADPIGRACIFPRLNQKAITAVDVTILRTDPDLASYQYLRYLLNTNFFLEKAKFCATGTTRSRITRKNLEKIQIPLPSLSEQKRIVEILDRADELRKQRAEADALSKRILPALFIKMFGDPATNPMDWEVVKIGDLLLDTQYGTSTRANTDNKGLPVLRMNNIDSLGWISLENLKYIELSEKDIEKYLLNKGDILFNRTNSKELVGKTGLWIENIKAVAASYLIKMTVNKEEVTPEYVWAYMNTRFMKQVLFDKARSAIGMANINAQELKSFSIPKPDLTIQIQFSNQIHSLKKVLDICSTSQEKLDNLFQNLLYRAFSGELTAEWREAHMTELLQEMEHQTKALNLQPTLF